MTGHGGNIEAIRRKAGRRDILDFSASINPLGLPAWLRPLLSRTIGELAHYPDPDCNDLVDAAVEHFRVPPEGVLPANGTSEILYLLPRLRPWGRVVAPAPSYSDYVYPAQQAGIPVEIPVWDAASDFAPDLDRLGEELRPRDLVFLGHPNNPTGQPLDPDATRRLCQAHPDATFVIDEAYLDFHDPACSLVHGRPVNVLVLRSLTKFYAIPGLRLGLGFAAPDLAAEIRKNLPPWTVNEFAIVTGAAALRDTEYAETSRAQMRTLRASLAEGLSAIGGLRVLDGVANFLLVRIDRPGFDAARLAESLLPKGIAIRVCGNFPGLGTEYARIAVRCDTDNARLLQAVADILRVPSPRPVKRHTPALMIQGTGSNAGKSLLVAALCRILRREGIRVAPFKAQNMALNSFVTRDGGEMGRAQVLQARAARVEPDVRMNPVLLKPTGETGSQVIVLGHPVGTLDVHAYHAYKETAFRTVCEAYDSLAAGHDAILLEGAGSPAEVNLKAHDIVNMRMAAHADAPVLLVGDIDRGGVYAAFVGTMEVLTEAERNRVAGFVVNKFRGEVSLLADAHAHVLRHTGKPVLGVIPMLRDLLLPEEDSVGYRERGGTEATRPDTVRIAWIDLPHTSNVADMDPLRGEPDVSIRLACTPDALRDADAVILPGSKQVAADLQWLRETGLADALRQTPAEVVGICGGLQMLGERIADPHGVEGAPTEADGLALLAITTTMQPDKHLAQKTARHLSSGLAIQGYEIHHGTSKTTDADATTTAAVQTEDGETLGWQGRAGHVWGCYLHGLFDDDAFRAWWIDRLRAQNGLPSRGGILVPYDLEPALDRLADVVAEALPIPEILRMMGL